MQRRSAVMFSLVLALGVSACSSDDDEDNTTTDPGNTSSLNPNSGPDTSGEPGGATPAIAGLWDASEPAGDATDVVYYNIADNGVITGYDYQQDGVENALGENCYVNGGDRTLSPEGGDAYAIQGVAITAVNAEGTLTVTFQEPDSKDFDEDGDTTETPTLVWPAVTTATLADLNECTG